MSSLKIETLNGVERVKPDGVIKSSTYQGKNGYYVKIWYLGSQNEVFVGPFENQAKAEAAQELINP